MNSLIYIDTNIFLDWWLDRADNILPLGDFAFRLFQQAISCRFTLLISHYTIFELRSVLDISETQVWREILSPFKEAEKVSIVEVSHAQKDEAEKIAKLNGLPRTDVLHAILARDNDAMLVTRDRHYDEITLCRTSKPENLL